jgi:SAM-dependent MidA family methyltransferase
VAADIPWEQAWEAAAFGPRGFYINALPYDHFTTSVEQAVVATDLLPYLRVALTNGPVTFIDVGAGTGLLAEQLRALLSPTEAQRTRFLCLDLRPRPLDLTPEIDWIQGDIRETIKRVPTGNAVLVAHEFLDDLPCAVVEVDEAGLGHFIVIDSEQGERKLGPILAANSPELAWLERWWPTTRPFMRCEVGITRDACWNTLTSVVTSGFAIAIDYAHLREDRVRGVWDGGTLAGYAHGTLKTPQTSGASNITAHVAIDALAESSHGNPQIQLLRRGPTPDFWWLIAAYGNNFPAPAKMKA